jgi:Bacterial virulence protein (VirJ)
MHGRFIFFWSTAAIIVLLIPFQTVWGEQKQTLDPFGEIHVYPSREQPVSNFLIMISGDGGWVRGVVEMANLLSNENSFIVGVDISQYLKKLNYRTENCESPSRDFQILDRFIHEKYRIDSAIRPILVGYSSGATLAYAAFVQAPEVFRAAFSFGFCPDLAVTKPFCKGRGLEWDTAPAGKGVIFEPAKNLQSPWIVFQGVIDQVCNANNTRGFVEQVSSAQFVLLPKVGHGYAKARNWFPQFQQIFKRFQTASN